MPEPSPDFTHDADRLVYSGHIWSVVSATFRDPSGESFERDVVRSRGAVAVVPVRRAPEGDSVVLVRQYRPPLDAWMLEIPAGIRDVDGEPDVATAGRELAEEVGLVAERLVLLTEYATSAGMTDSTVAIYLGTGLHDTTRDTHGPEEQHMEIVEMEWRDALDRVRSGAIRDAKTIIGLLLADVALRDADGT